MFFFKYFLPFFLVLFASSKMKNLDYVVVINERFMSLNRSIHQINRCYRENRKKKQTEKQSMCKPHDRCFRDVINMIYPNEKYSLFQL